MSAALQRVIVRMMMDPAYAARIQEGGQEDALSPRELAWLRAADPRAFRTDVHRGARLLSAWIQEVPASAACAANGDQRALFAFFSSSAFHEGVQRRAWLILSFLGWAAPRARGMAELEAGAVRARRRVAPRGTGLCLATGVGMAAVDSGALARWLAVRELLGEDPVASITDGVTIGDLPPLSGQIETLVFQVGPAGTTAAGIPDALGAALARWEDRVPRERARADLRALGADPGDEDDILDGLVSDGLIDER